MVANGAAAVALNVASANLPHVIQGRDLIAGKAEAKGRIVVLETLLRHGGGYLAKGAG